MSLSEGSAVNKEGDDLWTEILSLTTRLWLCTLPVIFLLAIVLRDLNLGWAGAAVSYVMTLLLCIGICAWRGQRKSDA
jgi:Na+-driven multidrug efflux pump